MGPDVSPGRRIIARSASGDLPPSLNERSRREPPTRIHLRQPEEPALFRGVSKTDGHPRGRAFFEASPWLRDRYRSNKTSPIV
jgi:hypothetical protein